MVKIPILELIVSYLASKLLIVLLATLIGFTVQLLEFDYLDVPSWCYALAGLGTSLTVLALILAFRSGRRR